MNDPENGEGESTAAEAGSKAFEAQDKPYPGRVPSAEEESGVSATDTEAESALGVGGSTTRSPEEVDEGERDEEAPTKGESDRPYGTSTGGSSGVGE